MSHATYFTHLTRFRPRHSVVALLVLALQLIAAPAARGQQDGVIAGIVLGAGANARRQNRVVAENSAINRTQSIGAPYRTMGDTRVPVTGPVGSASATGVPHFYQTKYATTATPLPLATYEEAQLIIAEADIRANSLATALPIIDRLARTWRTGSLRRHYAGGVSG